MRLIFQQRKQRFQIIQRKQLRRLRKLRWKKVKASKSEPWWTDDISAPSVFNILNRHDRGNVLTFLDKIRNAARKPNAIIRLNFKNTEKMFADATLLFKATMFDLHHTHQSVRFKCSPSKNARINEVLTKIEVLKLLGQTFNIQPRDETVIHWRVTEGAGADGAKYEPVLGIYDDTLGNKLSEGLYLGLTEAMTNTCHHAYPDEKPETEWWMFSQEKDGWLTVAICDLGVGIPATIHVNLPSVWEVIKRAYKGRARDSQIMDATIRLRKTQTRKGYRGKGLTQLASIVERAQEGSGFFIYSGKGCYAKKGKTVKLLDYDASIGGTVITWHLPLTPDAV